MRFKARIFVALLILFVLGPTSRGAIWGGHADSEEELVAKIARERNPVKKTKYQIRLARLKLTEGIRAYDQNDFTKGKELLQNYLKTVQNCWQTLQSSGRNAVKNPQGFKDLDIALREDDRLLEDLRRRAPYPENEVIGKVKKESTEVRDRVLDALFPGFHLRRSAPSALRPVYLPSCVMGSTG